MKRIAVVCLYVLGFVLAQFPSQVGAQTTNPPPLPIPTITDPGVQSPTLPKNVKTLLKQFQVQRDQLIKNLDGANDAQRQQILQQLKDLRDQLKKQLEENRTKMKDQIDDMKKQFGNGFSPGNIPAPNNGSGHGGRPRK